MKVWVVKTQRNTGEEPICFCSTPQMREAHVSTFFPQCLSNGCPQYTTTNDIHVYIISHDTSRMPTVQCCDIHVCIFPTIPLTHSSTSMLWMASMSNLTHNVTTSTTPLTCPQQTNSGTHIYIFSPKKLSFTHTGLPICYLSRGYLHPLLDVQGVF